MTVGTFRRKQNPMLSERRIKVSKWTGEREQQNIVEKAFWESNKIDNLLARKTEIKNTHTNEITNEREKITNDFKKGKELQEATMNSCTHISVNKNKWIKP